ncbi:Amidase [Penicillium diatomitis]|uniref:Amidase n=1 Tax=Penicillium diatomitis TaxID=2819901 RepID=A0A9W9XFF1_9EURO|nr:Amidase [Penicillium diatomitis]KAJ5491265.1 Amidase [Penicillium diatomitis]
MDRMKATNELNLLDASISDLLHALASGYTTSVDLVARYLQRISVYDANGPQLSAIPILNASTFEEATASDARRAKGLPVRALEGIPFLVKDNIKVKGMAVANGSPAFEKLIANEDATCVKLLRDAGAVLLGRTNMPAMAYGGMQRGIWGRAESPYNREYLAAAYASGSSNGSAVATTASFCAFSLGTETVSSGRSPASNNAIVAYTPSKGLLPLRGVFPLYPTCDVLVPHTRTVDDLLYVLDVLAVSDPTPIGDFYNEQPFLNLPSVQSIRPTSFHDLKDKSCLNGLRIGVPAMYIGGVDSDIPPQSRVKTRSSIIELWLEAKKALEECGAEVVETDFPLVTIYESNADRGQLVTVANLPEGWPAKERCELVSHAWDDFLTSNGQEDLATLTVVDPATIFPLAPNSLLGHPDQANKPRWDEIVAYPHRKPSTIFETPGIEQALHALEDARKKTFEQWMDDLKLDAVVFPANSDVGSADADCDANSSLFAWSNGVKYSNGNRPIRHLGVPTISVPMGIMSDTKMPVNLTFAAKAYNDVELLQLGHAFELATTNRVVPPDVPPLPSDIIPSTGFTLSGNVESFLDISVISQTKQQQNSLVTVRVTGSLHGVQIGRTRLRAYVNGEFREVHRDNDIWSLELSWTASERDKPWVKWQSPACSQTIITIIADIGQCAVAGKLILL